jgi:hypothetical protein
MGVARAPEAEAEPIAFGLRVEFEAGHNEALPAGGIPTHGPIVPIAPAGGH